jgi:hypothetical protein
LGGGFIPAVSNTKEEESFRGNAITNDHQPNSATMAAGDETFEKPAPPSSTGSSAFTPSMSKNGGSGSKWWWTWR